MGTTPATRRGPGAAAGGPAPRWPAYRRTEGFDELFAASGSPRPVALALVQHLSDLGPERLLERQTAADREMRAIGVTFRVYEGDAPVDRIWPFDVVPRVLAASDWMCIEEGLLQRLRALNHFIHDVYHDQRVIKAGVVPAELILRSPNFRPECAGVDPPAGLWANICGSDLVRDADGSFYVLEDNLRVPSGVSYVLENRMVAKRVFPELFRSYSIEPVDAYVGQLASMLASLSPVPQPTVVVLTPGAFNAAYFEHAFLAQQLGAELVEGGDLTVLDDDTVCMRTVDGLQPVDVIYRRVDDLFLDPEVFRRDSVVGVPGLMRAWRSGRVALVNAPGAGVADDKAIYALVPDLIRFYMNEEPILPSVPTWGCADPGACSYVLDHMGSLVMKPTNESGGYGIVIGPSATPDELAALAGRISRNPRNWVAQRVVSLSTAPTLCEGVVEPRHVDLRPFALIGPAGGYVTPGGLTRVARRRGSLIVNSSQRGGSKDTWIVDAAVSPPHDPSETTGAYVPFGVGGVPRPAEAWRPMADWHDQ